MPALELCSDNFKCNCSGIRKAFGILQIPRCLIKGPTPVVIIAVLLIQEKLQLKRNRVTKYVRNVDT
jgi:hypothetical protein